ncbi:MAG: DUF72 domain-containing protein, partial [Bacteroidota bacterium]
MKFGKLQDISGVDFSLPEDHAFNQRVWKSLSENKAANLKVYLGCTGWSMKDWVGSVYPPKTKTKDFLLEYGKQFNTIELNTTHYRIPKIELIDKWKRETPADFRFCPKIPQIISHSRHLGLQSDALLTFSKAIIGLEEKLGPSFMQLPPYFGADRLEILNKFILAFPAEIPLFIEIRHESWFKENALESLLEILQKKRMGLVITDVAGRRDVLHQAISIPIAMVRFV